MMPKINNAENIITRLLEVKDISEVCEIENQCFSGPWSEKSILESVSDKNTYFVVAEKNIVEKISEKKGKIIGYAGLYTVQSEAYMYNIAVRPDFQALGVGKLLMENLISYCLRECIEFISLEVRVSNCVAINLYKKLGFEILGERPKFYRNPLENAFIMTKYFK